MAQAEADMSAEAVGAPPPAEAIVQGKTELGMERGSLHIQEPLLCTLSYQGAHP